jgi:hypothetical protein
VAGLRDALGDIEGRGARIVVLGSAPPMAIKDFRAATGWDGTVLVDPTLAVYRAAGLAHSVLPMLDPRGVVRVVQSLRAGFRSGAIRGSALQQGGTFVLGPGPEVHLEWRDRFSGDTPPVERVVAAIPAVRRTA